jgi:hypothetical protein
MNDTSGNEGNLLVSPTISTPEGVAYYVVNFMSPLKSAEFKRGITIPITVEVRDEESLVENAVVDFKTPQGETIMLQEVKPGTYVSEYTPTFFDPIGTWYIPVQAVKTTNKTTKAGGNRLPVEVTSATLNLILAEPNTDRFFTGQRIEIKTDLKYPDGRSVENANVTAKIGNNTVLMNEIWKGTYSGYYLFTEKDAGTSSIQITATDLYGNIAKMPQRNVLVAQVGGLEFLLLLFYYSVLLPFWYGIAAIIGWFSIRTRHIWYKDYLKFASERIKEEEKRIFALEKDMQMKFFKYHSLNKNDYDEFMLNYKRRSMSLSEKKLKIQKTVKGLKPITSKDVVDKIEKIYKQFRVLQR